ncbi:MAG: Fe-S cluster assembly protein SufD [Frankiales bacterium]|nr:Fe-S cluster assembly protein SufD [Frankiales bacterium]
MSAATTETRENEVSLTTPARDHAPRVLSRDPEDFARPTGREEEWRFTPLRRFAALLDGAPSDVRLSWTSQTPVGVVVDELAADDPALAGLPLPVDRISALAVARADGAVRVTVPESAADEPVVLRLRGDDAASVAWSHVVLDVRPFARATVVVEHSGSAQYAEHLSVLVGDGASLRLLHVQDWADDAVHAAHVAVRVGRDATFRSFQASLGGSAVRVLETVEYAGTGGDAELLGVFLSRAGQHIEHRMLVDHAVPHCRSNVLYKGALSGDPDAGEDGVARSVWIGDVLIRAAAVGTDTYELNRNLLLTTASRADSVPNLEIETGEIVGAGHASATGRFDDEQMFYLQARGIPADVATRLVVRGFFADVVNRLGLPEWQRDLTTRIEQRLGFGETAGDDEEESE